MIKRFCLIVIALLIDHQLNGCVCYHKHI